MERNPYAPPAATVSDPVPAPLLERPYAVKRGVLLLWISLAFGLLDNAWTLYTEPLIVPVWTVALLVIIPILGFCVVVINKIRQRRHWARVVYLILMITGYPITIYSRLSSFEAGQTEIIGTLLSTASMVTDIVGIALIFTPPANRWFREQ